MYFFKSFLLGVIYISISNKILLYFSKLLLTLKLNLTFGCAKLVKNAFDRDVKNKLFAFGFYLAIHC